MQYFDVHRSFTHYWTGSHKKKKEKEIIIKIVLDFKVVKSRSMMFSMSADAIYTVEIVKREGEKK